MSLKITVGILTVSDSCSRGKKADGSGPALLAQVRGLGWEAVERRVVPDDLRAIRAALRRWCDVARLPLILTTGGTGLGPRDVTPEATRGILDKELPGLSERMRLCGIKKKPTAALSRAVCGSRKRSLVINLPGSPKGAVESFSAVAGLVPHAIEMLAGGGHGDGRGLRRSPPERRSAQRECAA